MYVEIYMYTHIFVSVDIHTIYLWSYIVIYTYVYILVYTSRERQRWREREPQCAARVGPIRTAFGSESAVEPLTDAVPRRSGPAGHLSPKIDFKKLKTLLESRASMRMPSSGKVRYTYHSNGFLKQFRFH